MTIEELKNTLSYRLYVLENLREGLQQSSAGLGKSSAEIRAKYVNLNPSSRK
jgi:hypothetical protein